MTQDEYNAAYEDGWQAAIAAAALVAERQRDAKYQLGKIHESNSAEELRVRLGEMRR